MADTIDPTPEHDIPTHRFSQKKVDDSWKEEVRRERAAVDKAVPPEHRSGQPGAADMPKASGQPAQSSQTGDTAELPKATAAEQQQSKIFMTFLAGLAQQTLMQLGEIESPFSGQREVDLQGARYSIELLTTIQIRTKNNLTADETNALTEALHDLKVRYVEIAKEAQRQMQAQLQKAGQPGGLRPGPGGSVPGAGPGRRK